MPSWPKYDTPTICNVVELFDLRPRNAGYMNETIQACFPKMPPMVGYALTSFFRSQSPPRGGDIYANLTRQIERFAELPGPAVMVFQDVDFPVAAATFGEVMCTTYKAFGAKGLITSGTGRDLDQVERIGFPGVHLGVDLCAWLLAHPGGRHAGRRRRHHRLRRRFAPRRPERRDDHPAEVAGQVADGCREFAAAEQHIFDYLKGSKITPAGFDEARKESVQAIENLGKRLRGGK